MPNYKAFGVRAWTDISDAVRTRVLGHFACQACPSYYTLGEETWKVMRPNRGPMMNPMQEETDDG